MLSCFISPVMAQIRDVLPLDEEDRLDEALCCFDVTADGKNLLLDDELGLWLDDLKAGAITVIFNRTPGLEPKIRTMNLHPDSCRSMRLSSTNRGEATMERFEAEHEIADCSAARRSICLSASAASV